MKKLITNYKVAFPASIIVGSCFAFMYRNEKKKNYFLRKNIDTLLEEKRSNTWVRIRK